MPNEKTEPRAQSGAPVSIHEHDDPRLIYEAAGQSVFAIDGETTVAA